MLTAKQLRFADAYAANGNKIDACIFAGYPAKSAASQSCQLLKNPKIMSKIAEIKLKNANKHPITPTKEFSKDDFIQYALRDYELVEVVEPNRARFLELAGKGAGILGRDDQKSNAITNNVQINITGAESGDQLWSIARRLIGND